MKQAPIADYAIRLNRMVDALVLEGGGEVPELGEGCGYAAKRT